MEKRTLHIIHTADFHLGTEFSSFKDPDKRKILQQEHIDVLYRLEQYQKEKDADLILIAGDLFDSPNVSRTLIDRVRQSFDRMRPAKIIICAGNHDPYFEGGYWQEKWPDNVYIAGPGKVRRFIFPKLCSVIETASFSDFHHSKALFSGTEVVDSNVKPSEDEDFDTNPTEGVDPDTNSNDYQFFKILMLHGDFDVARSSYNPISISSVSHQHYDYIALGHIHQELEGRISLRDAVWAYPGCPQGRGFDELGSRHFRYSEIDLLPKSKFHQMTNQNWQKLPSHVRPFLIHEVDCSAAETEFGLQQLVEADLIQWQQSLTEIDLKKSILRIVLKGEPDFGSYSVDPVHLKAQLENAGYFYIEIKDQTSERYDPEHLRHLKGFGSVFVQVLEEQQAKADNDAEKQRVLRARDLILKAKRRAEYENS